MNVVLLGPPGAGKGTQARRISERYGLVQLSTGDMLRAAIAAGTEIGKLAAQPIARGELLPDDLVIQMIADRLDERDCAKGFVLDGFPRTARQAEALDRMLSQRGIQLDHIIELRTDDAVLVERITGRYQCANCGTAYHESFNPPKVAGVCDVCGGGKFNRRSDDTPATVRSRLEKYHRQTEPVLEYYRGQGQLRWVDAMADIDEVSRQLVSIIAEQKTP